jgi:heme-degrading monooxygenase HmoA
MFSRVTLLEIDTVRSSVSEGVELFKTEVVPELRGQQGFAGALVLATAEGKGMIVTLWETEAEAAAAAGFATSVLERYMALFKAPPGREYYEVVFAEISGAAVA